MCGRGFKVTEYCQCSFLNTASSSILSTGIAGYVMESGWERDFQIPTVEILQFDVMNALIGRDAFTANTSDISTLRAAASYISPTLPFS